MHNVVFMMIKKRNVQYIQLDHMYVEILYVVEKIGNNIEINMN